MDRLDATVVVSMALGAAFVAGIVAGSALRDGETGFAAIVLALLVAFDGGILYSILRGTASFPQG